MQSAFPAKPTTSTDVADDATNLAHTQTEPASDGTTSSLEKGAKDSPAVPVYPEGGWAACSSVLGAWLILICTFGYNNAFGVYQSYYLLERYPTQTASSIAWIGSVQTFLQFTMAGIAGPLFDKGYFYPLTVTGSVIFIVSLFMTSLCTSYWQAFLAQGVGIGLGIGSLFLPAVAVVSQYFRKYRGIATGLLTTGSSVGGICLPTMTNKLISSVGFEKAVQYTGCLVIGCLAAALLLIQPFGGVRGPKAEAKADVKKFFREPGYILVVAGIFLVTWGLFFPIFFLQVFGEATDTSPALIPYLLAILNAGSIVGRTVPNILADIFGPLNLFTIMCLANSVMAFAFFGARQSPGALIAVAILYGITSGSFISLLGPALFGFAKSQSEVGKRMGMAFLGLSLASLTGTPIGGALVDKYGFSAAIVFCGVVIAAGGVCIGLSALALSQEKKTWRV